MVRTSNFTSEGLHNEGARAVSVLLITIIALSALMGDVIILVGTTKYRAIKLHRVVVVVIQHLAVNDLLQTVLLIVPQILSLLTQDWVLGELLCHVNENIFCVCFVLTGLLTSLLTTTKLLLVQFPLRLRGWSRKSAHLLCALCWIFSLLQPAQVVNIFLTSPESLLFSYVSYSCVYDYSKTPVSEWLMWFVHHIYSVSTLIMAVILIVTSGMLIMTARKFAEQTRDNVRWRGVLAITLTTSVFLISYLPATLVRSTNQLLEPEYRVTTNRVVIFLTNVNVIANFFVYSVALSSFRTFLLKKAQRLVRFCGLSSSLVRVHDINMSNASRNIPEKS